MLFVGTSVPVLDQNQQYQEQHWELKHGDSTRLCQHSTHGPAPGTGPTSTAGGRKARQLPWAQVGWLWPSGSGWVRGE
ncbi:unnamed protein product, partial [Gulo gulo]